MTTMKNRPVAICREYIRKNIINGERRTRKEYIHAMLENGIKRSTADYTWHQIFSPKGKLKNEVNEHENKP